MLILWFSGGVALVAAALGIVVFLRSPRHPAHATFALGMAVVAAETVLAAMALPEVSGAGIFGWQRLRLAAGALVIAPWLAFSRLYSRGDHAAAWARWRWSWLGLWLGPLALAVAFHGDLASPGLPVSSPGPSAAGLGRLGVSGIAVELLLLLGSVAILTQVERTFRDSVGVMRWRLKYMVLGVAALFGFRLYATSQALLHGAPDDIMGRAGGASLGVACLLFGVALARGRIFNVDVYPSHALLYRSVAVMLAGTYLVIVGVLARAMSSLGSVGGLPVQAFVILLALTGLAVLFLSERMRQQLKQWVSRHLRRPMHDYRLVWQTLTARTTSMVDEATYCRAVTRWISETFQTLSSSIWLLEDSGDRLRLGGSTLLGDSSTSPIEVSGDQVRAAVAGLAQLRGPVLLDTGDFPWMATLAQLQPGFFPDGGKRVGSPLEVGGRLLGLVTLGDRVGGAPFSPEDLELLKCVGDQVASGLLGLRLSGQLLRAKEMEAFQRMSTFFVHDLKNTASTLSLTLQNLQKHFGDPAFRDDALRAVQKSVQHLNGLIARLGRLRHELRVRPEPGDLAASVRAAIDVAGPLDPARLTVELTPVPGVLIDAEQIQKVVVNLLLNARDASNRDGAEIRVRCLSESAAGVIEVSDHGVGMSPEFVRASLFQPFQTTKHNGLGIGMFQSKMIVEAHHGRIDVQSSPGKGTCFRVVLPLAARL